MPKFRGKIFNDNVFEKYLQTLPSTKENSLVQGAIFNVVNKYGAKLSEQTGGYYITEPIKGRIGGDPVNYDGKTDIPDGDERDTFYQGKIAIGRAASWGEYDFATELTGENFMAEASEVKEYWDEQLQGIVLSILKGIFSMTGSNDFATKHTYTIDGNLTADGANRASQSALGDKKQNLEVMFMHSAVSTNLEGLNLIQFLKYTDENGITRDLSIGTYNGKLVVVDDEMPVEYVGATYSKTTDTSIDSSKTYYTRSGSAGSYVYTEVTDPKVADIGNYYEMTSEGTAQYVTYMFSKNFFEFEELGVKKPVEQVRDAKKNGGKDELISRKRYVIVPKYISYKTKTAISPEKADLENGANWELANNMEETNTVYVDNKLIPIVKIVSKG